MFDRLVGLLAPHECLVCGDEGALICAWCLPDAVAPLPERCYRCHAVSQDSAVCVKCQRESPLRYVWVRAQYQGVAKELIYRLKFARTKGSAQIVARLLGEALPTLPENTIVTYVPTATSRVRRRGYDQARVVATILSKERGLPCLPLLVRHGQDRQVGADRKQRIKQASGNYTVINNRKLQKAQVLLVDDILTTGATIEAAARVLKKAGARAVNAAIFAQKQ